MKPEKVRAASVSREKIVDYLLNPAHPDNGGKADFFLQLGFQREQWEIFGAALMELAEHGEVMSQTESSHGKKFIIVGQIQSPSGKTTLVRTIWIMDKGENAVRLVTAYPHKN
jgi:hypothetical protein